jgi:hypothetical protein
MEVEAWEDIPGYEDLYQASTTVSSICLGYNWWHITGIERKFIKSRITNNQHANKSIKKLRKVQPE